MKKAEEEKKAKFRRSLVYTADFPAGHVITGEDLIGKRPGTGIPTDMYESLIGMKTTKDVHQDVLIKWSDFN